jgi:hypothetical protein
LGKVDDTDNMKIYEEDEDAFRDFNSRKRDGVEVLTAQVGDTGMVAGKVMLLENDTNLSPKKRPRIGVSGGGGGATKILGSAPSQEEGDRVQ